MQRLYTILLTLTLLLTFVGQSFASVASECEMPHQSNAHVNMHLGNTSEGNNSAHHTMMQMDCCDEEATAQNECSCPVNGCTANSMLNVDILILITVTSTEKVNTCESRAQTTSPKSLYRPPMFA